MADTRKAIRKTAERLLSYSREVFGPNLRVVTRYNPNEHETIFTRDDVPEQLDLDEGTRSMFRHPLVRMQKAAQELSQYHPTFGSLDVAVYEFGTVVVVQFPITEADGIIVTVDWEGDLPNEFLSTCTDIVSQSSSDI